MPYMGRGKLTKHAQNIQGCEKCNRRNAVGIFNCPMGENYCYSTRRTKISLLICYKGYSTKSTKN